MPSFHTKQLIVWLARPRTPVPSSRTVKPRRDVLKKRGDVAKSTRTAHESGGRHGERKTRPPHSAKQPWTVQRRQTSCLGARPLDCTTAGRASEFVFGRLSERSPRARSSQLGQQLLVPRVDAKLDSVEDLTRRIRLPRALVPYAQT